MNIVENLKGYIGNALGYDLRLNKVKGKERLPLYIRGAFDFYQGSLMGRELLFAMAPTDHGLSIGQIDKQFDTIRNTQHIIPVLVVNELNAISRRRLVEKSINFIAPGKQMYLPALLLDLNEKFEKPTTRNETLTPSAQVVLLYGILKRNEKIEEYPLKQWAAKLNYTAMAVSQAADQLKAHGLCEVTGTREKYIHFKGPVPELWRLALPLLIDPVMKRVFVDELPTRIKPMKANESALPQYTEMNASRQEYIAMEKGLYYDLHKGNKLVNENTLEGRYCLEVWKYNPELLAEDTNVDPLSLYLCLKENKDERIQMALDKIIEQNIW